MRYITSDIIFSPQWGFRRNTVLAVNEDGIITEIYEAGSKQNEKNIEYYPGIISPGFVNTHCHIELSWMKGLIPEQTSLHTFIRDLLELQKKQPSTDVMNTAMAKAENEMLKEGVVAVGDIANSELSLPLKKNQNLHYHHFIEVFGSNPRNAESIFRNNKLKYVKAVKFLPSSITPHSLYSVSSVLIEKITYEARINNFITSIHHHENDDENQQFLYGKGEALKRIRDHYPEEDFFEPTGKKPMESLEKHLRGLEHVLLVHNTVSEPSDILLALELFKKVWFVLCPNANLYIENKLPDISMIKEYSDDIALGTDSLASNHQLSILEEMKTIVSNFPAINMEEIFRWATINGAKALRMEASLGSFETGKAPGIVHINNLDTTGSLLAVSTAQKIS